MLRSIVLLMLLTLIGVLEARNHASVAILQQRGTAHEATYSFGIDISRYQTIMWDKLDTNINFIICKASEGVTITDPKFSTFWSKINPRVKKGASRFA